MALDTRAPRSRRALLAAGLGGLGASVLHALGRPAPTAAADTDPLILGTTQNFSTGLTELQHDHESNDAFKVSMAPGTYGSAIVAAGVGGAGLNAWNSSAAPTIVGTNVGSAEPGPGLMASSGTSGFAPSTTVRSAIRAVQLDSNAAAVAVHAEALGVAGIGVDTVAGTIGVRARNIQNGTSILAISGSDVVAPAAKIGVYGYANQDANARAIYGKSLVGTGVWGNSDTGRGIFGRSTAGTGVSAQTDTGRAIYGTTGAVDKTAILGQNTNGGASGLQGFSGSGAPPTPDPQTGVQGNSNLSALANGVLGRSTLGTGVWGDTIDGLGVAGTGSGTGSVGVYAAGGLGLIVDGPSLFSTSGKVTINSGSSTTVSVPGGIAADSIGLAVLQTNRAGVWVRAVTTNIAAGTMTIHLNVAVPSATTIGWFLIN